MATVARLEAVLSAQTSQFDRAMDRSETRMGKLGGVAKVAGLAVAGGLAVGLEKAFKAGMDAEASQARLAQTFKQAHLSLRTHTKSVEAAERAGRRLGFTDDDTRNSLGSLMVATRDYRKSLQLLALSQDIARFKGIDQEQATKLLTAAMAGSQRAAKQLGITVPTVTAHYDEMKKRFHEATSEGGKNITVTEELALANAKMIDKQKTAADVIEAVKQRLHGQAKAYADTAAGAMEQFRAQVQHIEEWIGLKLVPAFEQAVAWVRDHWPEISAKIREVWTAAQPTIKALIDLVVSFVTMIRKHWGTIGPIVMQAVAVIKTQLAIITGIIKFFSAVLRGDWGAAWAALKGIVANVFKDIKQLLVLWKMEFVAIAKALGHAIVDGIKLGLSEAEKLLKAAVTGLFHKVIGWVKDVLGIKSPSSVFHDIGVNMIKGMVNGVGSMGGYLKKAVVNLAKSAASRFNPFGGHGNNNQTSTTGLVPRVVNALNYAREMGWKGQVTSGFRTYAQQAALYQKYLHGGPLAAPPGHSSHETGQAVDVTDYTTFGRIMARAPLPDKLYNYLGDRDPVHFSISGYDTGGWLNPGWTMAYNGTGRPERVVGPQDTVRRGVVNFHFHGPVLGKEQQIVQLFRNAVRAYERNNGRTAFGF